MPESLGKTTPLLQKLVDMLMASPDSTLHGKLLLLPCKRPRTLDMLRALSNKSIIPFDPLIGIQKDQHTPAKTFDIVVESTGERTINPNNVSVFDRNEDKVSKTTVLEFVAVERLEIDFKGTAGPIDRSQAVVAFIPSAVILSDYLQEKGMHERTASNRTGSRSKQRSNEEQLTTTASKSQMRSTKSQAHWRNVSS